MQNHPSTTCVRSYAHSYYDGPGSDSCARYSKHLPTEKSSELDLILARLGGQGHLVQVVEVRVAHGPLGRDPLSWVIHLAWKVTPRRCVLLLQSSQNNQYQLFPWMEFDFKEVIQIDYQHLIQEVQSRRFQLLHWCLQVHGGPIGEGWLQKRLILTIVLPYNIILNIMEVLSSKPRLREPIGQCFDEVIWSSTPTLKLMSI